MSEWKKQKRESREYMSNGVIQRHTRSMHFMFFFLLLLHILITFVRRERTNSANTRRATLLYTLNMYVTQSRLSFTKFASRTSYINSYWKGVIWIFIHDSLASGILLTGFAILQVVFHFYWSKWHSKKFGILFAAPGGCLCGVPVKQKHSHRFSERLNKTINLV